MKELKDLLLFQRTHSLHYNSVSSKYDVGFETPYWVSIVPNDRKVEEFDRRIAGYWIKAFEMLKKGKIMNDQISTEMATQAIPADLLQIDAEGRPIPVTVQTAEDTGSADQPLN